MIKHGRIYIRNLICTAFKLIQEYEFSVSDEPHSGHSMN